MVKEYKGQSTPDSQDGMQHRGNQSNLDNQEIESATLEKPFQLPGVRNRRDDQGRRRRINVPGGATKIGRASQVGNKNRNQNDDPLLDRRS